MIFCLTWIILSTFLTLIRSQNISSSEINITQTYKLVTVIVRLGQEEVTFTTKNSSTIVPTGKPLSFISDENYWLRTVILVPTWVDVNTPNFRDDIQNRFVKVIELAVERQQAKRYQLPEGQQQENGVKENVQIQVLNISRDGTSNRVTVIYAVTFNGYYIGAYSLSDDLKLVNSNEFSAYIGYPVQQIQSYVVPEQTEKTNWWIIGAVIGSTVGVLMCGWCLLFVYYNTCGRAFHPDQMNNNNKTNLPKQNETPSSPVLNVLNENEPRESSRIYLISTDVQTDANDDEELIRTTQPTNWVVPNQRNANLPRQSSLQLSTSFDNNQGVTQIYQNQKPIGLPTNSNNKNTQRRGSYMNGLNSPPASKSDSVGSITLKTNEEMQTIGISTDQEQKSADLRFAVDHATLGGVSGFINGISPLASYGVGPSHAVDSNPTEDIWKLYPFQRYQAADNVHRLTEQLTSDHPRPGPSTAYGEILMHSKEFQPKRIGPASLSRVFGLI